MKLNDILEADNKKRKKKVQQSVKKAIKKMGPKGVKYFAQQHSKETNPGEGETPYTPHPLSQYFKAVRR